MWHSLACTELQTCVVVDAITVIAAWEDDDDAARHFEC